MPSPDQLSPQGIDFITKCFIRDPKKRASAPELLQHEWIVAIKNQVTIEPQTPSDSGSSQSSARGSFANWGTYQSSPSSAILIGIYSTFLLLFKQEDHSFPLYLHESLLFLQSFLFSGKSAVHEASFGGIWFGIMDRIGTTCIWGIYIYTRLFFISDWVGSWCFS